MAGRFSISLALGLALAAGATSMAVAADASSHPSRGDSLYWISGFNRYTYEYESCKNVCRRYRGLEAVYSGYYGGPYGEKFYVCRSNYDNGHGEKHEGRAGYNLEPNWSKACYVGYGGKEVAGTPYDCLCKDRGRRGRDY